MSLLSLMIKFSPFLSQSFGVNDWQSCLLRTFPPKWVLLAISQSESSRGLAAVIVSCPVIHCLWSGSRICLWITSSLNSLSPSCFGSDTVAHILTRDLCTVQYSWKKTHEVCFKSIVKAWTNTIHRSRYLSTLSLTHAHRNAPTEGVAAIGREWHLSRQPGGVIWDADWLLEPCCSWALLVWLAWIELLCKHATYTDWREQCHEHTYCNLKRHNTIAPPQNRTIAGLRYCEIVRGVEFVAGSEFEVLTPLFPRRHITHKVIKSTVTSPSEDTVLITLVPFPWKDDKLERFFFKVKRLFKRSTAAISLAVGSSQLIRAAAGYRHTVTAV